MALPTGNGPVTTLLIPLWPRCGARSLEPTQTSPVPVVHPELEVRGGCSQEPPGHHAESLPLHETGLGTCSHTRMAHTRAHTHMCAHPQDGVTGRTKQVLPAPRTLCALDEAHFNELHVKVPDKSLFPARLEFYLSSVFLYNIPISRVVTPVPVWIRLEM